MARKDKKTLPASGAGIVRFFNDDTAGMKISPNQVVIGTIIIALICIALRFTVNVGY
ncbi:MAG: preprotein translocase subunit Sec61beta [Methanosphaera stadtmanae]|nr:preprotein translocase subunit Sec61beta [Methanosphaera stadtmanae]